MNRIIIIAFSVFVIAGVGAGTFYYGTNWYAHYPHKEFSKIKQKIDVDPENAATDFCELLHKIAGRKDFQNLMDKHFTDYIVNYLEVVAVTEKVNRKNEIRFLEQLYNSTNEIAINIVTPYILFKKSCFNNDSNQIIDNVNSFLKVLMDQAQFNTKAERFGLLLYNRVDSLYPNDILKDKLLNKIKNNLSNTEFKEERKQIWQQYMLAYCSYLDYKNAKRAGAPSDSLELILSQITDYIPVKDYLNFENEEIVMSMSVIELSFERVNYYLKDNKKKKAYEVLSNLTIRNPFLYFDIYADVYEKIEKITFSDSVKLASFEKFMPKIPDVSFTFLNGEVLNVRSNHKRWIFMEFWGTWCTSCVQQLPEIQSFYNNNKDSIKIYSIAQNSKNIESFLAQNNYTFPVADVEEIDSQLNIHSFPTKLLISPHGHYCIVPHTHDWMDYIMKITKLKLKKQNDL